MQEEYRPQSSRAGRFNNLAFSNQSEVYQSLAVLDSLDLRSDDIILFQLSQNV